MRRVLVVVHRWIGLSSAAVLVVLGTTGSILALAPRVDAWTHPSLHRVERRATHVDAQRLLDSARTRLGPAPVTAIDIGGPTESWVFHSDNRVVFVDPYTSVVIGVRTGPTAMDRLLNNAYRLHTQLGGLQIGGIHAGRALVDGATVAALSSLVSGCILWWKKKRFRFRRGAGWRIISWDLHSAVGIWGLAALLMLATSGLFIAVPELLFAITHSAPAPFVPTPLSDALGADGTVRCTTGGAASPTLDDVLRAADRAVPDLATTTITFPAGKRAPYRVTKRPDGGLGDLSTFVMIDRYCGIVAAVDRSMSTSRGFRIYSWNLAIHDGNAWSDAGRFFICACSLLLGVSSLTGVLMWVARARPFSRFRVPSLTHSSLRDPP